MVSCDLARDIGNHSNCRDDGSIGFYGFFFVAAGPQQEKGYEEGTISSYGESYTEL